MKKTLTLLALTFCFVFQANAQNSEDLKLTYLIAHESWNFQIVGEESNQIVSSLFANLPETKRKGYKWKFKNVVIPGLDEPVTLQVHQGLAGQSANGRGYFNTFMNEEYREIRLAQNIGSENPAIIIYVKRGRNKILKTEEAKFVKEYLLSLYGA